VGNSGIFRVEGLDSLFKMLRVAAGIDYGDPVERV
jgi:hypothetical protein